jgi:hypothetical protein
MWNRIPKADRMVIITGVVSIGAWWWYRGRHVVTLS